MSAVAPTPIPVAAAPAAHGRGAPPGTVAPPCVHLAGYRFVALPRATLVDLRSAVAEAAQRHGLRGTVLLATEGLNFGIAGEAAACDAFLDELGAISPALADVPVKRHRCATPPYRRMKVKVKAEIVRMDGPTLAPAHDRPPGVAPRTLARWIAQGHDDEGRALALLDTRNAFEVDAGAFDGAIDWRLTKFGDFPAALAAHADTLRGKRVVSYCTGGIRCEKASLALRAVGLAHAVQLDGGILQYFADLAADGATPPPGWRGGCFVFDERVALGADLAPLDAAGVPTASA